jgi:5-methylcytosine-specific restriction endonuclease McrA
MSEPKADYATYLQSDHWKKLAEETKRLAGYKCQVCNSQDRLETHHRTYERKGDELQSDLVCLCHSCHELFTFGKKRLAKAKELLLYIRPVVEEYMQMKSITDPEWSQDETDTDS